MVYVRKDFSKTIAFYLQDGVEVLDFAGPMEVFAYAGYEVFTVSATQKPIRSQGILTVTPDYSIENAPKADILAFFGGNSAAAYKNKKVIDWIKSQEDVQYYFSVCTGAFVLAESGILDGKTATTFHNSLDDLESQYPEVDVRKNVRFVDNGKVITTAGISAGIDGALHLVAKLQGLNAAKRTAYYMEYDNWNIGDGLILATDNPYNVPSKPDLSIFEGTYEYKDNTHLVLAYDEANGNLNAKIQGTNYPIYHEKEDLFSDTNSQPVFFKRNEKNEIVGYELIENTRLFKKLN
ncbi:DJ-1/PfpI family protein [Flavobacteriaceae bacterium TP-CH-4]|uniref:DJ-1/PfpI family protein n=2 Tax=Pelagihabitans pacificus TaxID=2696054 RepID=A0A967AVR1_9FLAO|nr:DJ-1/PfpI family protein [Pelagihabitans pacificus]